jgi:predicted ATPase
MSLSLTGRPDQGWSRITQALARAEELDQTFVLVDGLLFAVVVKLLRGDYDEAWRLARKMDALTREYNLPIYRVAGILLQGSIAVQRGALEEGLAGITAGLSQYQALGVQQLLPFFLSFLAEGYRRQRKRAEALQAVSDALSLTATNFDVFWEAELYRLKGELMLQQSSVQSLGSGVQTKQTAKDKKQKAKITALRSLPPDPHAEAEACFLKAIEITRRQEAKSLELRAVMSLARLWQTQGKQDEAHHVLAEIYHWFTEGFDTQDLREAKALLQELSCNKEGKVNERRNG